MTIPPPAVEVFQADRAPMNCFPTATDWASRRCWHVSDRAPEHPIVVVVLPSAVRPMRAGRTDRHAPILNVA